MNPIHRSPRKCPVPLALCWSHCGAAWRVTPWPEVRFECRYDDEWIPASPTEDALASAARDCGPAEWQAYLEFVPREIREFLGRFSFTRMEALQVAARCGTVLPALADTPALTAFLASHVQLRGTMEPCWREIDAVHERSGVFGLLEWLGLPASRQTLSILAAMADPDVPKRLLERLRRVLWQPSAIFALQRLPTISDRELATTCHAMAA